MDSREKPASPKHAVNHVLKSAPSHESFAKSVTRTSGPSPRNGKGAAWAHRLHVQIDLEPRPSPDQIPSCAALKKSPDFSDHVSSHGKWREEFVTEWLSKGLNYTYEVLRSEYKSIQ